MSYWRNQFLQGINFNSMAESIPLEESIPRNRLPVSINFLKYRFRRVFQSENTLSNEEANKMLSLTIVFKELWSHLLLGCLLLREAHARLFFGSHETSPIEWIGKPAPATQRYS
jgi:hypothetical protein